MINLTSSSVFSFVLGDLFTCTRTHVTGYVHYYAVRWLVMYHRQFIETLQESLNIKIC
jgi:hypothetical protein